MKLKSMLLLAVAVGCGLVAMLGVQQVLSDDKNKTEEEVAQVLVATAEISSGAPVNETNSAFKEYPKNAVPEGAVTETEQYEERAILVAAVPGEVIMRAKLGEKGAFGASSEIPMGMRVVTVSVNLTKTHSGLIMPGDRVDVLVTYKTHVQGLGSITKTKTVLEYIKVFATDHLRKGNVAGGSDVEINAKNISVLVEPSQANLLMLAQSKGQLHLALRRLGDDTVVEAADVSDLEFDDTFASRGAKDERPDEDEMPAGDEVGDVRTLLAQEENDFDETDIEVVEEEPEIPIWIIRIYEGDTLREEEIELPLETAEQADATEFGEPAEGETENSWQKWLQTILTGT